MEKLSISFCPNPLYQRKLTYLPYVVINKEGWPKNQIDLRSSSTPINNSLFPLLQNKNNWGYHLLRGAALKMLQVIVTFLSLMQKNHKIDTVLIFISGSWLREIEKLIQG